MGYLFLKQHLITQFNFKSFVMQEPTSFDPCENITWDEQLELMDKEQLIKYILHLEKRLLSYESLDEDLPW